MGETLLIWFLSAGCLLLSVGLSGMEAGVFALSRIRIRQQVRAGRRSAVQLHKYLENPEDFLWTILVGNTLANFWVLGWLLVQLTRSIGMAHPVWLALAYLAIVLLFYTLSDLLPKMLFRIYPNRLCLYLAGPFGVVHLVLRPLVWLVKQASELLLRWRGGKVFTGRLFGNREELRLILQESAQTLTSEERAMINRVLDLQSLTVRRAMTPLGETIGIDAATPVSQVLDLFRQSKRSRLPVWDTRENRRQIIGLVSLNPLLFRADLDVTRPVREHVRPALYLEEDLRLELALRHMQRGGHRLAVVLGPDRRESGILSLQDVLKVMFGEMSL